jgi:hypothetical protein
MFTRSILEKELLLSGIHSEFITEFSNTNTFSGCISKFKDSPGWHFDYSNGSVYYYTKVFESDIPLETWTLFTHKWAFNSNMINGEFAKKLGDIFEKYGYTNSSEWFSNNLGKLKLTKQCL